MQARKMMLPSQDDIQRNWTDKRVRVTCYVLCYNHFNLIEDALEGILLQRTNFGFKVVVYDDFSQDGTREILREYQERYPDIIFPYLADFNHHSVGKPKDEHGDLIEGDYVAFCEGDDYWIDYEKLQRQFDLMEMRNFNICIHPAIISFQGGGQEDLFCYYGGEVSEISPSLVFNMMNQFAPTASYFVREESYFEFLRFLGLRKQSYGDFFIETISADKGILYTPEVMSVYRRGVQNSYSETAGKAGVRELEDSFKNNIFNLDVLGTMRPEFKEDIKKRKMLVEIDFCVNASRAEDTPDAVRSDYMKKAESLSSRLGSIDKKSMISTLGSVRGIQPKP